MPRKERNYKWADPNKRWFLAVSSVDKPMLEQMAKERDLTLAEAARLLLKKGFEALALEEKRLEVRDKPLTLKEPRASTPRAKVFNIEKLGLPPRIVKVLTALGCTDLETLSKIPAEKLLAQSGFGQKSLTILNNALKPYKIQITWQPSLISDEHKDWQGNEWLRIRTKIEGACNSCRKPFRLRDPIMWRKGHPAYCDSCWERDVKPPPVSEMEVASHEVSTDNVDEDEFWVHL